MLTLKDFKTTKYSENIKLTSRADVDKITFNRLQNPYRGNGVFYLPVFWWINVIPQNANNLNARTLKPYSGITRLTTEYFPGSFTAVNYSSNKTTILSVHSSSLVHVAEFLCNSSFFACRALTDIWATDFPSRKNRFEITYSLLSNKLNTRVYLKTYTNEWGVIPSLNALFESASWLEREVWDMFGVAFSGHPDLRRILTDYGFFGFPLRKDFPLTGFSELRYDDTTRRVASEHLNLIQELRLFFFSTPWKK